MGRSYCSEVARNLDIAQEGSSGAEAGLARQGGKAKKTNTAT
jgi:hypothetical protein